MGNGDERMAELIRVGDGVGSRHDRPVCPCLTTAIPDRSYFLSSEVKSESHNSNNACDVTRLHRHSDERKSKSRSSPEVEVTSS